MAIYLEEFQAFIVPGSEHIQDDDGECHLRFRLSNSLKTVEIPLPCRSLALMFLSICRAEQQGFYEMLNQLPWVEVSGQKAIYLVEFESYIVRGSAYWTRRGDEFDLGFELASQKELETEILAFKFNCQALANVFVGLCNNGAEAYSEQADLTVGLLDIEAESLLRNIESIIKGTGPELSF